ncbi:MAG: hypothetical protein TREMPRED_003611 [Tremellales sp. Tagirdzhanova-0007]|nr:MAG: hypothetical protein TREMPRED_003611 [Tremellales sp. Tagirdzhanova-0007]
MPETNKNTESSSSTVAPSRFLRKWYFESDVNWGWGPEELLRYQEQIIPYGLGKASNSVVLRLSQSRKQSVIIAFLDDHTQEYLYSPAGQVEIDSLHARASYDFRSDIFGSGQAAELAKQADKKDLCNAFDEFGLSVSVGDPVKTLASWSKFFELASAGDHEDIALMKHDADGCLYSRMRAVISRTHYLGPMLDQTNRYESCDNPHVRGTRQARDSCPRCSDPISQRTRTHFKDFAKPVSDEINRHYSDFHKAMNAWEFLRFIEKESSLADDYAYAWYLHQSNLPYSNRTEPKSRVQKWKQKLHSQTSTSGSEEGIWRPKYQSIHEILIPPLSIPEVRDDGTLPWEVLHDETLPLSTTGNETKDGAPAGT